MGLPGRAVDPRPVTLVLHGLGLALAILAGLAWAWPARAIERPQVAAMRATGAIRVDGVLDEPDWARAAPITGFLLIQNREGQAPSESTAVRVLFDDARVYFGCRCWNRGPGAIRASLAPRDQVLELDNLAIQLDTYRDRHRAYTFGVNPYGVQFDGILVGGDVDLQWDGVWSAECARDSAGWSAELAIPLRSMRFPESGPGIWGLWIRRQIQKNDEVCSWPPYRMAEAGDVMLQAADLTGLAGLRGSGLFDLQPYAASTWSSQRAFDEIGAAGPWDDQRAHDIGLDARVPLSSTLVLNGTINPDFSQIEADALQIDVNRRYPLYYGEKRPFFLEGADIFKSQFDLVYTRRIADPAYGAKVAGTLGHLRVGGIVVRDDGGGTLAGMGAGPAEGTMPKGWFHVGRASYEIGENSSVGVLLAAHQSERASLLAPPGGGDGVPYPDGGTNLVLAADAKVRLSRGWFFAGQVAHSSTSFDTTTYVSSFDTTGFVAGWNRQRTALADLAYMADLEYLDGIRRLQLYQQYLGPRFRAETGFLERVDLRKTGVNGDFFVRPENAWLRSFQPLLESYVIHDRGGLIQEWAVSPMIEWEFEKQTSIEAQAERAMERWQARDYLTTLWTLELNNSTWKTLDLHLEAQMGDGIFYAPSDSASFRGWSETYEAWATLRPGRGLTAELGAERNRFSRDHGRGVLYDVWVLGAKTTWQFTRRLYARFYPQYDTDAEHFDADALLGYVIHPGSVIYLGFNGDGDRVGGRQRTTGRTAFFKVSYLFQR
jgi:hypothetical protein